MTGRKILSLLLIILLFLSCSVVSVSAEEDIINSETNISETNISEEIRSLTGADKLEELLPDSIKGNESGIAFDGGLISGEEGYENVFELIIRVISDTVKKELGLLTGICGILIISSLISSFGKLSLGAGEIINTVCIASLCLVSVNAASSLLYDVSRHLEDMGILITGMVPVMASLCGISGQVTTATVQSSCILMASDILQSLSTSLLIPGVKICLSLLIASTLSAIPLTGLMRTIKNGVITVTVGSMTLMSGILYFQTALSASADTALMKTAKYAAGTFIPIVGSMVSDAVKTVSTGVSLVKSTTGIFGITAIIYIIALPIASVVIKKLIFSLSAAAASLLGASREESILRELASVMDMLIAFISSSAVFFLIALTVFMKEFHG